MNDLYKACILLCGFVLMYASILYMNFGFPNPAQFHKSLVQKNMLSTWGSILSFGLLVNQRVIGNGV